MKRKLIKMHKILTIHWYTVIIKKICIAAKQSGHPDTGIYFVISAINIARHIADGAHEGNQ